MRRLTWITVAVVAVFSLWVAGATGAGSASAHARANSRARLTNPYMRICGLQFCIGQQAFYPYGATFYESTAQAGIDLPEKLR